LNCFFTCHVFFQSKGASWCTMNYPSLITVTVDPTQHGLHTGFYQLPTLIVCLFVCLFVCLMVFNATFNNISVISWRSVLLVEETVVPEGNHRPITSQWQTLSHNVVSSTPRLNRVRAHNLRGDMQWLHM
jgi:hypothetical protein